MPDNITDYIKTIQSYDSPGVCNTQSTSISVGGSSNEFVSSNEDFTCWRKGDLFIVWGTTFNDGVYKKANDVNAYRLQAEAPLPGGGPVSLTTENCSDKLIAINEVDAIGQGSMVSEPAQSTGYALMGVVGSADLTAPSLDAYAMTGPIGECAVPSLTAEASGEQGPTASGSCTTPSFEIEGYSGTCGACEMPALEMSGTASGLTVHGDVAIPSFWASAADQEYTDKTVWGHGAITFPPFYGGSYADANVVAPVPSVKARTKSKVEGKCYIPTFEVTGFSTGSTAHVYMPDIEASASGTSGAQGTCIAPTFVVEAYQGAHGGGAIPSFQMEAYSGYPDYNLGSGDCEAPAFTATGQASKPPEPQSGSAEVTAPTPEVDASGTRHAYGVGSCRISGAVVNAQGVVGTTSVGEMVFPALEVASDSTVGATAQADIMVEAFEAMGRILSQRAEAPILEYVDDGENWTW